MPIKSLPSIRNQPPHPREVLNFSEKKCKELARENLPDILQYRICHIADIDLTFLDIINQTYQEYIQKEQGCFLLTIAQTYRGQLDVTL